MITVPEAAKRVGRDPETVRRWIRSGRLRSQRIGTQHLIDEADLESIVETGQSLPLPRAVRKTWSGRAMPDAVALIRELRDAR
jgi:excisionase family DNA binding protein